MHAVIKGKRLRLKVPWRVLPQVKNSWVHRGFSSLVEEPHQVPLETNALHQHKDDPIYEPDTWARRFKRYIRPYVNLHLDINRLPFPPRSYRPAPASEKEASPHTLQFPLKHYMGDVNYVNLRDAQMDAAGIDPEEYAKNTFHPDTDVKTDIFNLFHYDTVERMHGKYDPMAFGLIFTSENHPPYSTPDDGLEYDDYCTPTGTKDFD